MSPVKVLSGAVDRYNQSTTETEKKVKDLLPLLPAFEKLQLQVVGSNTVQFVLGRADIMSCAEQYLARFFRSEGAGGAPSGQPSTKGGEAGLDYVLRLPSRNVYLKMLDTVDDTEASRLRELARELNPAEVWVFSDGGETLDERLDPVFVSEGKVLRGRLRSMTNAAMLYEFFGRKFSVASEPLADGTAKITIKLAS